MASEEKLGEISRALSHSIERMDNMQSRKAVPLFSRLRQHFSTQSGNITSVILAGCVLAVAAGRLNLKQEHQEEKERWFEERTKLTSEIDSLRRELQAANALHEKVVEDVNAALASKGWFGRPVPDRIQRALQRDNSAQSVSGP